MRKADDVAGEAVYQRVDQTEAIEGAGSDETRVSRGAEEIFSYKHMPR